MCSICVLFLVINGILRHSRYVHLSPRNQLPVLSMLPMASAQQWNQLFALKRVWQSTEKKNKEENHTVSAAAWLLAVRFSDRCSARSEVFDHTS